MVLLVVIHGLCLATVSRGTRHWTVQGRCGGAPCEEEELVEEAKTQLQNNTTVTSNVSFTEVPH